VWRKEGTVAEVLWTVAAQFLIHRWT
jgi:hypothetical protein